jgi:hypothetical protein
MSLDLALDRALDSNLDLNLDVDLDASAPLDSGLGCDVDRARTRPPGRDAPADPVRRPPTLPGGAAALRGPWPPPKKGILMKRAAGAHAAVPVALAGVSWHTLAGKE